MNLTTPPIALAKTVGPTGLFPDLFGAAIRERRKELGLSRADLAQRIRADENLIAAIETSTAGAPSARTILALARALKMDAAELRALVGKRRPLRNLVFGSAGAGKSMHAAAYAKLMLEHDPHARVVILDAEDAKNGLADLPTVTTMPDDLGAGQRKP